VITLPLAVVALVMAIIFVPSHINETTAPVDNLGGVLSAVVVGAAMRPRLPQVPGVRSSTVQIGPTWPA